MEQVTKIIISTTSGYGIINDAWEDRIVITDHNVHYEFKPETQDKHKPISWTAKANNPEHILLFNMLSKVVLEKIEAPMTSICCDVGVITLSLTFTDKQKKSRSFIVLERDLNPCFSIVKKIVRLATHASDGMLR